MPFSFLLKLITRSYANGSLDIGLIASLQNKAKKLT